jgi:cysteine-rich repeat protein
MRRGFSKRVVRVVRRNLREIARIGGCLALLALALGSHDARAAAGDLGTKECRDAQLLAQASVPAAPKNHGAVVRSIARLLHEFVKSGDITGRCAGHIVNQFGQGIPIDQQEPSGAERVCGDGELDPGEACDDGAANSDTNADACRLDCSAPVCGDGVVDTGEECDDGAANSDTGADACRLDCSAPACGDGVVDTGEQCDDGNFDSGDGCSGECVLDCPCADGFAGVAFADLILPFCKDFMHSDITAEVTVLDALTSSGRIDALCVTTEDPGTCSHSIPGSVCTYFDDQNLPEDLDANASSGLSSGQYMACRQLILDRAADLGVPCEVSP